jgi:hypothetical protein
MPTQNQNDLTHKLEAELAKHPEGIGVDAIVLALGGQASRRTVQRRLAELVSRQRITTTGIGRATRYRVPRTFDVGIVEAASATDQVTTESYVPISAEGEQIRQYVRRSIQERRPVGYERALLEGYHPNQTYYLSHEIRTHLMQLGSRVDETRPAGTYARDLLGRLLIDLSWASSRLEGNTYTRLDTQNLIERGEAAQGKDRREAQMILNHKAAIEMLVESAGEIAYDPYTIFNLHSLLSDNLLADVRESGRLRERIVEVSGTVFHPLGIPQQIEQLFRELLTKAEAIQDPFEQAFFSMVHLPYLQPFVDVNKRVSRLAANIALIRRNLCPLSFVDVPEHAYVDAVLGIYELRRIELLRDVFMWAYERSCQRYMAIRQTTAEPNPLRQRYREVIIDVVAQIVRARSTKGTAGITAYLIEHVPNEEIDAVRDLVKEDLDNIHEGNIARYRLKRSEYLAWQTMQQDGDPTT